MPGSNSRAPSRLCGNRLNFVVDNPYESVLLFSANQNESFQIDAEPQMTHPEMT